MEKIYYITPDCEMTVLELGNTVLQASDLSVPGYGDGGEIG